MTNVTHSKICSLLFMSEETKKGKRLVRRRATTSKVASDASSPIPDGPVSGGTCGHEGCGLACNVRYVGPTSSLRDHHMLHAARGVTHIWAAAVVTGLAVVITGSVAFSSVQASADQQSNALRQQNPGQNDWARVMDRLSQVERALGEVKQVCGGRTSQTATSTASLPMAQDQGGSERLRPAVRRGHLNAASVIPPVVPAVPPADGAVTP